MCLKDKKGSVLITLIVAIVIMAVLGLGIYTMYSSSSFSELLSNRDDNAYQLAKAGIRYAVNTNGTILGDFFMPDSSHKFNLARNGQVITSTGIVNAGTFLEARRVLTYTLTGVTDPRIPTLPIQNQTAGTTGSIANNGTTITLGGSSSPGVSQSFGAIWYNGNNTNANCSSGACSFGNGLRAYFEFQFPDNTNSGDGFTFAIMSALTNTNTRVGGFSKTQYPGSYYYNGCTTTGCPTTSVAGGELQGYAGPGNTDGSANSVATDGLGLRPPKMAIQFDTYTNGNNTPYYLAGTRNDPACSSSPNNTYGDYVALQFWGDTPSGNVILMNSSGNNVTLPLSSFDDNTHGLYQTNTYGSLSTISSCVNATATVTTTPAAAMTCPPVNGLGAVCYFMEDGNTRSGRIEITRSTTAVQSGTYAGMYAYQINVWVELKSSLSALTLSHIQDVLVPYTDTSQKISQTVYFNSADNSNLANVFWGFTEGTGDAVQQVAITNTDVFFPNTAATCSYAISPANATYTSAGGSGSVTLTATSNCYWAVQSLSTNPWITITSTPQYGLGSGTISYTVTANTTGTARTGLVNIAGQTFTVIQTAPQTIGAITFTPSTLTVGGTTTASATATSGLPVTFTSTTPAICTVSGTNGSTVTGVATGTCTIAANQAGNSSYDPASQVTNNITVACPTVTISTTSPLPNGTVGTAYSQTLSASGGIITSWAISSGSLPGGLTLNTSTGVISGTPTASGTFTFSAKAINSCGNSATKSFTITITCPTVTINTTSLPNGAIGTAYSQTLSASGGTITSWAIASGSLPGGLSLNTSTGVISGTPTTGGKYSFTVRATNGCGNTATQALSIRIPFNPYQVYAGTTMYYISGSCQTLNSGSYVNLSYNNSITFYRNSGCSGSTYAVSYSAADTVDAAGNANGQVTVNRTGNNWSLVDR
jgi:hypothetical protein